MNDDEEISAAEAAPILGYQTPESVYALWKAGRLKASRVMNVGVLGRKRVYFNKADVIALADAARRQQ